MEKDAALRQAKLDYLEAAQGQDLACHPALWAAFVQLGNIEPLGLKNTVFLGNQWLFYTLGFCVLLCVGVWYARYQKVKTKQ
jgi:hypothetical protein